MGGSERVGRAAVRAEIRRQLQVIAFSGWDCGTPEPRANYREGDGLASLVRSGHVRILVYCRSAFHTRF
jgi:hypothetical protein